MENKKLKTKLLSIDAWNDGDSWQWNNWCLVQDEIYLDENVSNRKLLKYCRDDLGILSDQSKGKIEIEDDGYNIVLMLKSTRRQLYAFEYGSYWEENGL